jgi:transposase
VNTHMAEVILADAADMSVFPGAGHGASRAGICLGNAERAGEHRPSTMREGNRWLRGALTGAAPAADTRSA